MSINRTSAVRSGLELALTACLFLAAAIVVTYPLVTRLGDSVLDRGDSFQVAWLLTWNTEHILSDPSTLFNAPVMYPVPYSLAYIEHMRGLLILFAPLYWLSHNPILAFNLTLVASYAATGLGCFLFMRLMMPRTASGWCGAFVAGLLFAFSPWRLLGFGHVEQVAAWWIGPMLFCLIRGLEQPRWRYWVGFMAFTALQTLISYYYIIVCGLLILAVVVYALVTHRTTWKTSGLLVGSASLVVLIVHLPLMLVYLEDRPDQLVTPDEQHLYSLQTRQDLLGSPHSMAIREYIFGQAIQVPTTERALDAGIVSYLLAGIGFVLAFSRSRQYRAVAITVAGSILVSLLLSLGPYVIVGNQQIAAPFGLLKMVPGLGSLRAPARLWQAGLFGIAVLGGGAAAWMATRMPSKIAMTVCVVVCSLIILPLRTAPDVSLSTVTIPGVYNWIRISLPEDAVVLQAPLTLLDSSGLPGLAESEKMLDSLYYQRRTVNSYLAYMPPDQLARQRILARFPADETLACAQALGVTHILVDRANLNEQAVIALADTPLTRSVKLTELYRDDRFSLFALDSSPVELATVPPVCERIG